MRPSHINIVGRSKHVFHNDVYPELRDRQTFKHLIATLAPGAEIILSKKVLTIDDIAPLIDYLIKFGIPRGDIRVKYPEMSAAELLQSHLSAGLAESGLTFGADVAEHDEGLARYFITTQSFRAIESRQRHLVIGPKGSGKSAILQTLGRENKDSLVITPEHYATDVLDAIVRSPTSAGMSAYVTTWKYTLLVEIVRRLVQNNAGEGRALAELRKYLIEHGHLSGDLSLFERFVKYLGRIGSIKGKIGPAEAEINLDGPDELERLFKMDDLLGLLPALRRVLRRSAFTVFIDELDQSWNNSETANRFLVALLTAAIQLKGIDENLHVVVFLRSEIFDLIKPTIAQLDKLRSDIEVISWSPKELTNLIVTRALDSMGINPERLAAETAITTLFRDVVKPSGVPTFEYLLSRTSSRPREVIQFSNLSLRVALQLDLAAILPEAVLRAEEEFSTWKLEYIVAENMFIYPRLDLLLDRFRGASRRLTSSGMDSLLTGILLEVESDREVPEWLRAGLEPERLLNILYALEVVGIERVNTTRDEMRPWESYEFAFSRPKGKPEQSSTFLFHPGLWKALELV